jgi:hypothetical protein
MFYQKRRPKWGILYLVLPLAGGLFWLEMKVPLSEVGHRAAQVGIVLLTFGLVELWLRANRLAMLSEDRERQKKSGWQSRVWLILSEEVPAEEPGAAPIEPALLSDVRAAANGHGHVPRTLVTAWSSSDSGPLPIRHSRFDAQWGPWTAGEEK